MASRAREVLSPSALSSQSSTCDQGRTAQGHGAVEIGGNPVCGRKMKTRSLSSFPSCCKAMAIYAADWKFWKTFDLVLFGLVLFCLVWWNWLGKSKFFAILV